MNIDKTILAKRKKELEQVAKQLKTEFFGLDLIIDKVISSVYAWYVFPELIKRPVIVNLWGMTGVGKTQLVRRLSALLGFGSKFVEIQMDGTSGGSSFRQDSICSVLSNCIDEGEAGILLLDELQRFRTVDDTGGDVKVDRFQDVWMLLSDGKFAANSDMFQELEMTIAYQLYNKDWKDSQEDDEDATKKSGKAKAEKKVPKKRMFRVSPYEARNIKKLLRLPESVTEIMTWEAERVESLIFKIRDSKIDWQIDYTKLLIFVSGNLDTAFIGSTSTEDCDTDADFYHKITSQITSIDIKKSLIGRFKPEQISRLGSNHVIYPSMAKASYQQLIKVTCDKYVVEMTDATNIRFNPEPQMYDVIYDNSVYPTQGTRPVFSAIHKIFSTGLVNIACWCLEHNIHDVSLTIDVPKQQMVAVDAFSGKEFRTGIDLEISNRKAKISTDMKTLVAVHESGHAVAYALLTKSAPSEAKINALSFSNGYILPNEGLNTNNITTKRTMRNKIAIALGGMVAEEIVFGPDNRSSGCMSDITTATAQASLYIRRLGYDGTLGVVNTANVSVPIEWNTNLDASNVTIEAILQEERDRVRTLLTENVDFLRTIVDALLDVGTLDQKNFIEVAKPHIELGTQAYVAEFSEQYKKFSAQ